MSPTPKSYNKFIIPFVTFIIGILIAICCCRWWHNHGDTGIIFAQVNSCAPLPASDPREGIRIGDMGVRQQQTTDSIFIPVKSFAGLCRSFLPNQDTVGGSISKCDLIAILNSMPKSQTYVNYLFGYDAASQQMILFLKGGTVNPQGGNDLKQPLIYRTGSAPDCFCPVHCGDGSWAPMVF